MAEGNRSERSPDDQTAACVVTVDHHAQPRLPPTAQRAWSKGTVFGIGREGNCVIACSSVVVAMETSVGVTVLYSFPCPLPSPPGRPLSPLLSATSVELFTPSFRLRSAVLVCVLAFVLTQSLWLHRHWGQPALRRLKISSALQTHPWLVDLVRRG